MFRDQGKDFGNKAVLAADIREWAFHSDVEELSESIRSV
jgi:hypothetical protein